MPKHWALMSLLRMLMLNQRHKKGLQRATSSLLHACNVVLPQGCAPCSPNTASSVRYVQTCLNVLGRLNTPTSI